MKKNVASQKIGAQMVDAADGSAFTGSVTVAVTGDAGTQATGSVGSGACAHEGNGYHTYAPAQAETNYDLVAFTFTGTGAVPATVQVFTDFPQTGDTYPLASSTGVVVIAASRGGVRKNTARAHFPILMTDSTNHNPATGKTVTVTIAKDGDTTFGALTDPTVTEMEDGWYEFDFAAGDVNADTVAVRATATGCDDNNFTILTSP